MLDTKIIKQQGMINLYELSQRNYVIVFVTGTQNLLIPLITTNKKIYGYIDFATALQKNGFSQDQVIEIQEMIINNFNVFYPQINKVNGILNTSAPQFDKTVVRYVTTQAVNKQDIDTVYKIFEDEGYNIDLLKNDLSQVNTFTRNYEALKQNSQEAQKLFKDLEQSVQSINSDIKKAPIEAQLILECIRKGENIGCLLTGPAGTGKSKLAEVMAYALGAPLLTYQGTDGTLVEDLIGQYVPDDKNPGGYKFAMGPLLQAYLEGYVFKLDEINRIPVGIISLCNQLLDTTPSITLYGTRYYRHKNFVLLATMNSGYSGTYSVEPSLKSRFPVLIINQLTKDEFYDRMKSYCNMIAGRSLSRDFFDKLYQYGSMIASYAKTYGEKVEICIRNAQYLINIILGKACTKEEFTSALDISYLNYISVDNENYEQIFNVKADENYKAMVDKLYELYDFKAIPTVAAITDFSDLILSEEDEAKSQKASELEDEWDDLTDENVLGEDLNKLFDEAGQTAQTNSGNSVSPDANVDADADVDSNADQGN